MIWAALIPMLMQMMQSQGGKGGFGGMQGPFTQLFGQNNAFRGALGDFGGMLGQKMGGKTGGLIGSLAGGNPLGALGSLFGGGGGSKGGGGVDYLGQIAPTIKPYYDPYINAGKEAMGTLMPEYKNLISDPTAKLSAIGANYKASPGYQYNVDQATNAANQAAAAGGMVGSPAEQQSLASNISGLASQDYNQFLQNALGLYGQGLGGMGNINQMGFNASSELAQNLAQALQNQAQLQYANQANQQQQGGFLGGLF